MGDIKFLPRDMIKEFFKSIYDLHPRKMTHDQIKLMFETLFYGAFRISEVLQITPESILDNGMIQLDRTKTGWENCKCSKWAYKPKRLLSVKKDCRKCEGLGRYRIPQFGWVREDILRKLRAQAKLTEPYKRIFPITRRQALRYTDNLIGSCTHAFRHTFLTYLLETEKLNIGDIKLKARHTSLQTTTVYIEDNQDYTRSKENKVIQDINID
ncbi:MAG: hypothetical protein ACRD9Q_01445 [Nitrososphaeraceae archaeon]